VDWFDFSRVNLDDIHVWSSPSCIADVCVKRMAEMYHVWPESKHICIDAAIITPAWRKQLLKFADVLFNIVHGPVFWPPEMWEPLTFAIVCPIFSSPSFKLKYWDKVGDWSTKMSSLWRDSEEVIRDHMFKLWAQVPHTSFSM